MKWLLLIAVLLMLADLISMAMATAMAATVVKGLLMTMGM